MKYEVEITRISYATETFLIEADNEEQAEEFALEEAYNTSFDEDSAEYEVESCVESDYEEED